MSAAIREMPEAEQRNGRIVLFDSLKLNTNKWLGRLNLTDDLNEITSNEVRNSYAAYTLPGHIISWKEGNHTENTYVMSPNEYTEYTEKYLNRVTTYKKSLIKSSGFSKLDNLTKREVMLQLGTYAREQTNIEISSKIPMSEESKKTLKAQKVGIAPFMYWTAKNQYMVLRAIKTKTATR